MSRGILFSGGLLLAMGLSWCCLVLTPHLRIGSEGTVRLEETGLEYPLGRSGDAVKGAAVYRAHGCFHCHTQQLRSTARGADLRRGWGSRPSLPRDCLRETPPMLGQRRWGPDLADLGGRQTNAQRLLLRLYDPRWDSARSIMPAYSHLFTLRKLESGRTQAAETLVLPPDLAPPGGVEIRPRPEAWALAAYLLSLRLEPAFFEEEPKMLPEGASRWPRPKPDPVLAQGRRVYGTYCAACHESNGQGLPGKFPPLAGSDWINGRGHERVVRIVLDGLQGPITVRGQVYDNVMLPWRDQLSDEDIAAVLTFVGGHKPWGNSAPPVTPDQVRAVRAETRDRATYWTPEELLAIPDGAGLTP
ncbi:MAG TPA: c-type cytochrome [Verrucomicrobiota bacterium]|nr:c-type cytochrome [Verrucomicrobiota bacterium]HNU50528.1 c-type cytochrome [Verrucomicrobiota bacterium]